MTRNKTSESLPSDMCAQRRLKSACASVQSDQSSFSAKRNFASLAIQSASSENSDQTVPMRRLVWLFTGRTYLKVRFLTQRLIWFQDNDLFFSRPLTLCMLGNRACFSVVCGFFLKLTFSKTIFLKYHQNAKQFGSRFCRAWSGSKLFA